jgi:hypothetical protein
MKRALVIALCAAAVLAQPCFAQEGQVATPAAASCAAPPTAPTPYLPAALPPDPVPPKCLNLEKNTTTCSDRLIKDWNAKTKVQNDLKRARINEMNAYGRELQKYQNAATDYAQCEQDRVMKLAPE